MQDTLTPLRRGDPSPSLSSFLHFPKVCSTFLWKVYHQDCLLFAGGFSETYAALCDYNGFAFREEIQWVSWSVQGKRDNDDEPPDRQGSRILEGLLGLKHPMDILGTPQSWELQFCLAGVLCSLVGWKQITGGMRCLE